MLTLHTLQRCCGIINRRLVSPCTVHDLVAKHLHHLEFMATSLIRTLLRGSHSRLSATLHSLYSQPMSSTAHQHSICQCSHDSRILQLLPYNNTRNVQMQQQIQRHHSTSSVLPWLSHDDTHHFSAWLRRWCVSLASPSSSIGLLCQALRLSSSSYLVRASDPVGSLTIPSARLRDAVATWLLASSANPALVHHRY